MSTAVTPAVLRSIAHILENNESWLLTHKIARCTSLEFTRQTGKQSAAIVHDDAFMLMCTHAADPARVDMFPLLPGHVAEIETEIYYVYVRPSARKQGRLRQMLLQTTAGNLTRLQVTNASNNHDALLAMWQKLGFKVDAFQPNPDQTTLMHRV
jgi:GNAT superfamily N-acetyltransferase